MNGSQSRLIDLMLDELEIASDPELYPDRQLDRGVVPWAMVAYLRQAEDFPVAPSVTFMGQKFRPLSGGRCLWAAQAAHFSRPLRCVLYTSAAELPPHLWARTTPFSEAAALFRQGLSKNATQVQVLCFSRPLSPEERLQVERDLAQLSLTARRAGLSLFAEILALTWAPNWEDGRVLSFRTHVNEYAGNSMLGMRWADLIIGWRRDQIVLIAWNGRAC